MQKMIHGLVIAWMCSAGVAAAAERPVTGKAPDWVQPAPAEIQPGAATEAAVQVLLDDQQVRFSPTATETYIDERLRIQKPQGLQAIGTISISWQPDADVVTVHRLVVRRGAQVRDLLGTGEGFTVLRREDLLEQATLTGMLTAVLQPTDLQVGDILEFAYTRRHADPVVPDKPDLNFGWRNAPVQNVRFRASWPKQMAIRWQLRDFKPALQESTSGAEQSIAFTLDNPAPLLQPTGAPARYAAVRRVELTAFQSWPEVSQRFASLYANASRLAADSTLRAEIERISKASTDPKARAAAALRLVQEQIRYVLLAMNDGALVPATAEQTWQRRYGDCKAKTALLLALLRELGIQAEPVTVNTTGGDGIDRRLPAIGAFDHVLVRAQIGGKSYWLDGTRPADRNLDLLKVPNFGWGLPLVARGSELVRIQPEALTQPDVVQEVNLDASAGLDKPAHFQVQSTFHGDSALAIKLSLDNADAAQRDQGMRNYWRRNFDGLQVTKVTSAFDEATTTLTWTAEGTLPMEWTDDGFYETDDMRLGFKPDFSRPDGTDIEAPYAVSFPEYTINRLNVKLPTGAATFALSGQNIDQTLAGWEYKRSARIDKSSFTAEASSRALVPEISAKEAHAAEAGLREMYKNILYIHKTRPTPSAAELQSQAGTPLDSANAYVDRGVQMLDQRMYEPAISEFNRAMSLEPRNGFAWGNRGIAYYSLRRFDEARADFRKTLEFDPHNVIALRGLGALALDDNHPAEAVDLLSQSLAIEDNDWARERRADAYLANKDVAHAAQDLVALSRADPERTGIFEGRAINLMMQNRRSDVEVLASTALNDHIGAGEGAGIAARLYLFLGAEDKAHSVLNDAISKHPTPELYMVLALTQRDVDKVIAITRQALSLDPQYFPALAQLVSVQMSVAKYPDALQTMERMEAVKGPQVGLHAMRAEARVHMHDTEGAAASYAAARALARGSAEFNNLCWSEAISNFRLPDALKDCESALKLEANCAPCLDSQAFVLLRMARNKEAIAIYNKVLALNPRAAMSLFGRGVAESRLGKEKQGDADMAAARAIDPGVGRTFAENDLL